MRFDAKRQACISFNIVEMMGNFIGHFYGNNVIWKYTGSYDDLVRHIGEISPTV